MPPDLFRWPLQSLPPDMIRWSTFLNTNKHPMLYDFINSAV